MGFTMQFKSKRIYRHGMSELLAIVIGIMITIGVGVALYTIVPRMITTSAQSNRVAIDVYATTAGDNTAIVTITVKNLGQKDISSIELSRVEINGNAILNTTATGYVYIIEPAKTPLAPGEETSMVLHIDNANIEPGAKIVVVLRVDNIVAHGTSVIAP